MSKLNFNIVVPSNKRADGKNFNETDIQGLLDMIAARCSYDLVQVIINNPVSTGPSRMLYQRKRQLRF